MTLQAFSATVISPVDRERMKQGEILIHCKRCKKPTWHKVYIVSRDGSVRLKRNINRYNSNYPSRTERFECLACGTTKTVRFKPKNE